MELSLSKGSNPFFHGDQTSCFRSDHGMLPWINPGDNKRKIMVKREASVDWRKSADFRHNIRGKLRSGIGNSSFLAGDAYE
jgi:hypothetical protein